MKQIIKHIADDGSEFNEKLKCSQYECLCICVDHIMSSLVSKSLKGNEHTQHDKGSVRKQRDTFLDAAAIYLDLEPDNHMIVGAKSADHCRTIIGRLIDDSGVTCLRSAWCRFSSMNINNDKEFEQPYFAYEDYKHENL